MESEDSAPNCSSNGNHSEMDDYLDEALEDDDDCDDEDDDYNYRNQNAAVSWLNHRLSMISIGDRIVFVSFAETRWQQWHDFVE